jgi:hypothetical protein
MAFATNRDGNDEIYTMNPDGSLPARLTNHAARDIAPAWSPDGTKIVFQSFRDGLPELYVLDGSTTSRVAAGTEANAPDWQPRGGGGGPDTTPPVLAVPGPVAVDATSPAGATVSYSVSAIDAVDPSPHIACSPASGTTFAVGVTAVSCTATDASGNSSGGFFAVTVRGAQTQLGDLFAGVIGATTLTPTQKAFLTLQLRRALENIDLANSTERRIVCNALRAFSRFVGALSGNGIEPALAAEWRADAARIRSVIGPSC